jgi:hypothetical protein
MRSAADVGALPFSDMQISSLIAYIDRSFVGAKVVAAVFQLRPASFAQTIMFARFRSGTDAICWQSAPSSKYIRYSQRVGSTGLGCAVLLPAPLFEMLSG